MATDGAAAASPFLETVAVEDMLAGNCEEARGIVHSLQADRTCWQLDEIRCWWRKWFEEGCRGGHERIMGELREAGIRSRRGGCLESNGLDEGNMTCFWLE